MENTIEGLILEKAKEHENFVHGGSGYSFGCGAHFVIGWLQEFVKQEIDELNKQLEVASFGEYACIRHSLDTLTDLKIKFNLE